MKRSTAAFTLVETIVALAVLAVLGVLTSYVIIQGSQQLTYAIELERAMRLAEIYLDEVIATRRWEDPPGRLWTPRGGGASGRRTINAEESTRGEYDDCDDYGGFISTGSHRAKDGIDLGQEFDPFTVLIDVVFVDEASYQPISGASDLKRVQVEVRWRQSESIKLTTFLANA